MAVVEAILEAVEAVEEFAGYMDCFRKSYRNFQLPSPWNLPWRFPVECYVDSSMEISEEASEELYLLQETPTTPHKYPLASTTLPAFPLE